MAVEEKRMQKKKRRLWIGIILAITVLLIGGYAVRMYLYEESVRPLAADEENLIKDQIVSYVNAVNAGDLETARALCTEDAVNKSLGSIESALETLKGNDWSHGGNDVYMTSVDKSSIEISQHSRLAMADLGGHSGAGWIAFMYIKTHGKWKFNRIMPISCD
jgi:hypothetical protein